MRAVSGQSPEQQDTQHRELHQELALPEQHPDDCLLSSATCRVDLSVRVCVCAVPSEGSEQQEEQHPEPHQDLRLSEQHQDRGSEGGGAQDAAGRPLCQGHRLQPVHIHAGPCLLQTGAGMSAV